MNQSKQFPELKNQTGFLNDSLIKLTSKVEFNVTHNKMLETQISQLAQQIASSSQPNGTFPGQTETNPKGQLNDVTLRNGRQLEDPVVKTKASQVEKESNEPQGDETKVESENPNAPPPYKPKISFPQRFAKSKLDYQFRKFVEMLNKPYINVSFTEALFQMTSYAKFLKEILSNKRKIEEDETMNITKDAPPPYKPKISFPQRFAKFKLDYQFRKPLWE